MSPLPKPDPERHDRHRSSVREAALGHRPAASTLPARACRPSASCRASSAHRARRCAKRCAGSASGTSSSRVAARASSCARIATGRSRCSPAYLRYGKPEHGPADDRPHPDRHARDAARGRARGDPADRVADPQGGTAGARPRWRARGRCAITPAFAREDFEVMRQIAEAARFTPGAVAAQPRRRHLWSTPRSSSRSRSAARGLRRRCTPSSSI